MLAEHEPADQMRSIEGFQGFRVVQVSDDDVVLVIFADAAEVPAPAGAPQLPHRLSTHPRHPLAVRHPEC
jgi:hypothetical protein